MKNANEALRMLIESKRRLTEKFFLTKDDEDRMFIDGQICGLQAAIDILSNKY